MRQHRNIGLGVFTLVAALLIAQLHAADEAAIRTAAERGLALLHRCGPSWHQNTDCFSCHHQTLPMFAMAEASRCGFPLDRSWMTGQAEFTHAYFRDRIEIMLRGDHVPGGAFTVAYGLWALALADYSADETSAAMVTYLLKVQGVVRLRDRETGQLRVGQDGRWRSSCRRPPLQVSEPGATILALTGMQRFATRDQQPLLAEATAKAEHWLASAPLPDNEDRLWRLWRLRQIGGDQQALEATRAAVLAAQREDGGWSQTADLTSDAYASGQSLFILLKTGLAVSDSAVQRAAEFLLRTQGDDGSWLVETRAKPVQPYFDNGDPHGRHQFLSVAATSWAVAALVQLLPAQSTAADATDPQQIAALAIKAAGGEGKLLKLFRIKERLAISSDPEKKGSERTSVLEPPKYWWLGKKERVRDEKEPATFLVWAWTLGVLTDPNSKLEALPEIKENDAPAVGVRVSGTIDPPMDLYFSQADHRLVRIDWRSDIHRFSDWREHDGAHYPARCAGFKKATGKMWYFTEILELERLRELPAEYKR